MVSRPVVQSLGSQEVQDLGTALRQLARNPRDLSALLAAGRASLAVDDLDAAMGFYGRAQDIAPQDPRVKSGIASVFLRSGRPVQALQLYDQISALDGGVGDVDLARDRGLAYDLVGDFENAQKSYGSVLVERPDDAETLRRLAISQAMAGEASDFEETLRPLLAQSDPAAFRARAFGLAILGEQDRASSIVNEVMPRDLASRLTPYLAYMPRLTNSQQAAAANLGIFPRAADIGREDPEIAQYRSGASGVVAGPVPPLKPALAA
ncbi:MAG: SPOR domain-containing protein, partial [Pseudomonadota bacterium]